MSQKQTFSTMLNNTEVIQKRQKRREKGTKNIMKYRKQQDGRFKLAILRNTVNVNSAKSN